MAGLLIAVLAIVTAIVSDALRDGALELANERIHRASRQIALISENSVAGRQPRYFAAASDSVVRRALRDPSVPRADIAAALAGATLPTDSALPIQLWTAGGRLVYSQDTALAPEGARGLPGYIISAMPAGSATSDSLRHSMMYDEGTRVVTWFVFPVRDRGRVLGFIAHKRRLTAGPITHVVLRELSGMPASFYYRNADGSLWATAAGEALSRADAPADSAGMLVAEEAIGSSQILVGMSIPRAAVLASSRRIVQRVVVLSAILVLAGALVSWWLTRRLTSPLGGLAGATRRISQGDYSVRVPPSGSTEVRSLASMFNDMARELESVYARLEEQTRRAQDASAAKSDFLATVSHELRTPLNAIGGYVELLDMELRGPITAEIRQDLSRIRASQRHLLGLINDILDLARVEARTVQYRLAPVPVDALLEELTQLMSPQAASRGVSLIREAAGDVDRAVMADPDRLRQIVLNLLSNAIRHTPPRGEVRARVEVGKPLLAIVVEDSGPGVPRDRRETIFEPFVQLDRSLTSRSEGLGLGLAISRDLARGMGGDITYRDGSSGACFVVTLPAVTAPSRESAVIPA
jgi:signal transduction histidine kinase